MKKNPGLQKAIRITDLIAFPILAVTAVSTMYYEIPWLGKVFEIFTGAMPLFAALSIFVVISVFMVDLKKYRKTFIPVYVLDLICIFGNIAYMIEAASLFESIFG